MTTTKAAKLHTWFPRQYFMQLHAALSKTEVTGPELAEIEGDAFNAAFAMFRDAAGIWLIGNGGSLATAQHIQTDLLWTCDKNSGVPSASVLLTSLGNDIGFENVFSWMINRSHGHLLLVALSCSGNSKNILKAVDAHKANGGEVMTFSGFGSANPLRRKGDVNFWVPSGPDDAKPSYGITQLAHEAILHALVDALAGKSYESAAVADLS